MTLRLVNRESLLGAFGTTSKGVSTSKGISTRKSDKQTFNAGTKMSQRHQDFKEERLL